MGIDFKKLKKITTTFIDQPLNFAINDFYNYTKFLTYSFFSNPVNAFDNKTLYLAHFVANPKRSSRKITRKVLLPILISNFSKFKIKARQSVALLLILRLQQYIPLLKPLAKLFSFKYLENIFAHLPEKTNLLFRLDNKTALSLWKGLQTTTI